MVEEELPLKQGLKRSVSKQVIELGRQVEEELPLKQGLKQFFGSILLILVKILLKRNFH